MNVIYDSENYYVAEYPAQHGYELVDKHCQRGTFFQGDVADKFAQSLRDVVAQEGASVERLDEFLGDFDVLMVPVSALPLTSEDPGYSSSARGKTVIEAALQFDEDARCAHQQQDARYHGRREPGGGISRARQQMPGSPAHHCAQPVLRHSVSERNPPIGTNPANSSLDRVRD